jgi:RND family efflux transporter MFP subunit
MERLLPPAQPGRNIRPRWLLLLGPLAGLVMTGCEHAQPELPPPSDPKVEVSVPVVRAVTDYDDFPGRIDAVESVDIRARVSGYLAKSHLGNGMGQLREGTEVAAGTLLFQIDPRPYKADLAKAEATISQNLALLNRLNRDYERAISLLPTRAISREDVDKVAGDRAAAAAAVEAAKASRDMARLNVEWTAVTTPISGRLSRRLVDPGNLVKADDTILTNIVSLDPMYAYFDVPERTLLKFRRLVRDGKVKSSSEAPLPVRMELADEDDFPHEGNIDFVDNRVDPGTGTLKVRGAFANPRDPNDPNQPRLLSPGLFVRIRLPVGTAHEARLVAERALGTDQGNRFVFVVNADNKVEYRRVKIGSLHSLTSWVYDGGLSYRQEMVQLREITDGLGDGERIVVNGLQRVRDGVRVEPHAVDMLAPR